MSGSENKAGDEEAETPAEVVKRRGVEPGSYGGLDVAARSMDLIAGGRGVDSGLQALEDSTVSVTGVLLMFTRRVST